MVHEITPMKRDGKRRCLRVGAPSAAIEVNNGGNQLKAVMPVALELSRTRSAFVSLPDDIFCKIFKHLMFEDIHNSLLTCKEMWRLVQKKVMFRVLVQLRWPQLARSPGGGVKELSVRAPEKNRAADFFAMRHWYRHILARDVLEQNMRQLHFPVNQLLQVVDFALERAGVECGLMRVNDETRPWILESIRLYVEAYDYHNMGQPKDWDLVKAMTLSRSYLLVVLQLLEFSIVNKKRELCLLTTKAVRCLCRDERNRMELGNLGCVDLVASILTEFRDDPVVLEAALWSLVHHSRPVGGIEGQSFDISKSENYAININRMWNVNCLEMCWEICEEHKDKPSVLAKVFWLAVNLSLPEQHKDAILTSPLVKLATDAIKRYPDHWEVNYRAIFSLVNICCYARIKDAFLRERGFELLGKVMSRWPKCMTLQRTALNVIKGFTTTQDDVVGNEQLHNGLFRLVCCAVRDSGTNDNIRDAAEIMERLNPREYPWCKQYSRMAWWMHDLVLTHGH